jgi:formylglycine-generating enzyme
MRFDMTRNTFPQGKSVIALYAIVTFLSLRLVCFPINFPMTAQGQSLASKVVGGQAGDPTPGSATAEDSIRKSNGLVDHSNMVRVEGGSFEMGGEVDKPIHTVTVPDFYIDKYEVTVAQYKKFCTATRRTFPDPPQFGWMDDNPVVNVTWTEAREYAAWAGKRLPTEAEWEYAARGGKLSKGYRYSGEDDPDKVAWYDANSQKTTHPVGTKAANELGIYDMSGNAAEWCSDYYGGNYYARSPKENPTGPTSGSDRVVRGGSFMGDLFDCQVSFRRSSLPDRTSMRNGFRCASSK